MIRAYADNVVLKFLPRPKKTAGGLIHIPDTVAESRVGTREAEVMAVGPGHTTRQGKFIPTCVQVGELVLVDALAGQNYDLDLTAPRHNKPTEWADERGEMRIVREDEILCVIERGDTIPAPPPDGTFVADGQVIA
jgi:chaperonin GroES